MPTREQYERAIALAERAGDEEAKAELIRRAQAQMTGPGSFMEKIGAGMQDVVTGTKQLVGATQPGEVDEHRRIAEMSTGGTLGGHLTRGLGSALAVTPIAAFAPATVAGAAAAGAGSGVLQPVEEGSNQVSERLKNAAIGGVGGAAVQGVLNVGRRVLPGALEALRTNAQRMTGGGRQRVAERAFVDTIDPADRAAAEQALQRSIGARTPPFAAGVSGAPITTAVAARGATGERIPSLLGAERQIRETMGDLAQPLRDVSERAAGQRWGYLQNEVGADVPRLAQGARDVYDNFIQNAQLVRLFDERAHVADALRDAMDRTTNQTIRSELERIFTQYGVARARGDVQSLHEFRMTALDDMLSRVAQSDRNAARILQHEIQDVKNVFDVEMNRALGNGRQWSRFLDDYGQAAQAREQGEAGNTLLARLAEKNETPGGVPQLTGSRQQLAHAAREVDRFGTPVQSPPARNALETVRGEIGDELAPYAGGPRGSATAQNLNPSGPVLQRAMAARSRGTRDVGLLGMGAMLGEPATGVAAVVGGHILDRQSVDIARRMIQYYADPQMALRALAAANVPPAQRSQIAQAIVALARPSAETAMRALPATLSSMGAQQQ